MGWVCLARNLGAAPAHFAQSNGSILARVKLRCLCGTAIERVGRAMKASIAVGFLVASRTALAAAALAGLNLSPTAAVAAAQNRGEAFSANYALPGCKALAAVLARSVAPSLETALGSGYRNFGISRPSVWATRRVGHRPGGGDCLAKTQGYGCGWA